MLPCCAIRASVMSRFANLRIEIDGPRIAIGGSTTFTRLPSASRASTIGLLSSTRRPTAAAIRCATLATCASSRNFSDVAEPARALDVPVALTGCR